jgi:hypothetical protein
MLSGSCSCCKDSLPYLSHKFSSSSRTGWGRWLRPSHKRGLRPQVRLAAGRCGGRTSREQTRQNLKENTKCQSSARGHNWATLFLGDINTGAWPSRLGELKLKIIYDRQSVGQSVLEPGIHLEPVTNCFSLLEIFFRQLRVCYFVAPSLTRGRVCNLLYNCFWSLPEQSLLARSAAELTAIFYCLI